MTGRYRPPSPPRREHWRHMLTSHDAGQGAGLLARTLAHICGPHAGTGDPLRPGSKIAVMPTGEYCTYYPQGVPGDHVLPWDIKTWRAPASSTSSASPPRALRLRLMDLPDPETVATEMFRCPGLRLRDDLALRTGRISIPRGVMDAGREGLARAVMRIVDEDEGRMCMRELGRMEPGGQGAGPPDMAALLETLEAANAVRPPDARLDTVLLDPRSLGRMGGAVHEGKGWKIRSHGTVPAGHAYAMSSATGPALLRGPTAIDCGRDEFAVRHFCVADSGSGGVRVALPAGAAPGQ